MDERWWNLIVDSLQATTLVFAAGGVYVLRARVHVVRDFAVSIAQKLTAFMEIVDEVLTSHHGKIAELEARIAKLEDKSK